MKTAFIRAMRRSSRRSGAALLTGVLMCLAPSGITTAMAQGASQTRFSTPDEGIRALAAAAKARDAQAITTILGPEVRELSSGDAVLDDLEKETFAALAEEKASPSPQGDAKITFLLGEIEWPFAIPLVKDGEGWRFDTKAGAEELLTRRIGEDELEAIAVCRAYTLAQWEYFTEEDWDSDGVAEYAQNLTSSPGQRNGLYWPAVEGQTRSPLAGLVGAAREVGYTVKTQGASETAVPLAGYRFKILTRQGVSAPGGRHGYVINGNMLAGFALVAYPEAYGRSGIMSFIVNQQGRVYEKDLGPNTAAVVAAMMAYDPDPSWSLVTD